jgi:YVTN family beta-propeller protein
LYISNEDDAKASVYDPKTGQLIAEIPVGLEPEGVAISPDGKQVIVTSESTNMLHVIAVPEHRVVANILVGARPRAAVFSRDGKEAYATSEISGEVKRVDMVQHTILKKVPLGDDSIKPKDVLLSKDESLAYVAGGRANQVIVLDAKTLEIKTRIPVGKRVWGLAMARDGSRIYTTNGASNNVSVIDTATHQVVATIEVGEGPWGVVIDD